MKSKALTVGVSSLAVASVLAAGQAVALKRVVKVGDSAIYTMKLDLDLQSTEVQVSFDAAQRITQVNPDGSYVMTENVGNAKVVIGGNEIPDGEETDVSTTTFSATGQVLKVDSQGMGSEHRLANLTAIIWPTKPVDVGSKWVAKTGAVKDSGTLENDYSFEVLARETLHGFVTFKISAIVKEVGGSGVLHATHWVDVKTGLTVKSTGEMKNVELQGMPMDAKYVLELAK